MAFGGAIKLTGENEYKKALQQITQNLKEVSSQMKVVTTEYGKNDTSINGLTAKENVLNQRLTEQTNKLKVLQSQYSTMASKYAENTQKHEALVQSYNNEKAKLDQLKSTVGTTSAEYQNQKAKVEQLASEVRKSTTNQEANAQAMSNMRIQMNNAQADINKTTNEIDELNRELAETPNGANKLGDSVEDAGKKAEGSANGGFTVFKGMLANLGAQAITGVINGLASLGRAFISVGKQAVASFAEYEQLVGGVDTLFKDASNTVQQYANNAYKTAGMSANEYMSTVTSFSASLISSLGGDTKKAAEIGDMAITDMSDNANKMGTSMEMIQNAYQGFAKQNYTMLDNLKLGRQKKVA